MGYYDNIMDDGSVVESSIPINEQATPQDAFKNFKIYKAQVERVIYADDERNRTGAVEYDLTVLSSNVNEVYRQVSNAVSLNALGGINDWSETVYKEVSKVLAGGAKGAEAYPENKNGDFVAVAFLEGNDKRAVILGPWRHRKSTNSAKKEDGHRMKGEYNGVSWEINKDGEFILNMLGGPRDDNGNLTNESNGNLLLTMTKDGKIKLSINDDAILTIDKATNTIELDAAIVKIGTDAAQALVRGDAFRELFNTHFHQTGAGPTSAPVSAKQMDPASAGTHLSDKHKVE